MTIPARAKVGMTLEEFLRWPRIEEKPYLEYLDGRIEAKVSPQRKHSTIEGRMVRALDQFAEPRGLGVAFPELRCTFGGRSIVPDVVFQLAAKIPRGGDGQFLDESTSPPDIHIEIRSPGQGHRETIEKIRHSLAHGCPLAWYVDPDRKSIEVHRPGRSPERLGLEGELDGTPTLPGFLLPVAEVFGWLQGPAGLGAGPR